MEEHSGTGVPPLDAAVGKPTAGRRSPQEKKQLSYDRDRRNSYGENDQGSRKSIPRNKRRVSQANRHHDPQALQRATGTRQPEIEDITEQLLHRRRRKTWRKWPDSTLREVVQRKLRRRQRGWRTAEVVGQRESDDLLPR